MSGSSASSTRSARRKSSFCRRSLKRFRSWRSGIACILVTKGDTAEQQDKLERSGLAQFFTGVEVLPEKTAAAYRALAEHHGCEPERSWMIGNSPKSDINPCAAGGPERGVHPTRLYLGAGA